jgi:LacI family transcriptional regulator
VARYAAKRGWVLDASMAEHGTTQSLLGRVDGVIVNGLLPGAATLVGEGAAAAVAIGLHDYGRPIARVWPDHEKIGRLGARYLMDRGHRRLAFVRMTGHPIEQRRADAFETAVREAGGELAPLAMRVALDIDAASTLAEQLERIAPPIALMAENDARAVVVLDACEQAGLRVPEQAAVLGVDNDELICRFATAPLSSVQSRMDELGYQAAAMLDAVMDGRAGPDAVVQVAPGEVVTRRSTDLLAVPHLGAARALRYVLDHYREPLTVQQVAEAVGLSRRSVYLAFRKHLGRTVSEEVTRLRVGHAKRLLRESSRKLAAIADEAGFTSAEHMSKTFARELGEPPGAWRKAQR